MHFFLNSINGCKYIFLVLGAKPGDALVDNGVWAAGETSQRIANRASMHVSRVLSTGPYRITAKCTWTPPIHPDFHPLPAPRARNTIFTLAADIMLSLSPCVMRRNAMAGSRNGGAPICISLAPLCLFIYDRTPYLFYLSIHTFSRCQRHRIYSNWMGPFKNTPALLLYNAHWFFKIRFWFPIFHWAQHFLWTLAYFYVIILTIWSADCLVFFFPLPYLEAAGVKF